MNRFERYDLAIADAARRLHDYGQEVHTEKWQGVEIADKPHLAMRELLLHSFTSRMPDTLEAAAKECRPNLPWADDHFQERVGGLPLNPGKEYANWPYYKANPKNDQHRVEEGAFSHTYMERMWPKHANQRAYECMLCAKSWATRPNNGACPVCGGMMGNPTDREGIRYAYGDTADVVSLLVREPFTRQAFLPIWFPEDTGVNFGGRVPCTIGYHFMRRADHLHVVYYIRSCDYVRHFRDDIYLCDRLTRWMIEQCQRETHAWGGQPWANVKPGLFTMHITSLHCFKAETPMLKRDFDAR